MKSRFTALLVALFLVAGIAPAANAVTLSSTELIEDQPPFEFFDRNLTRTRTDAAGNVVVETNDATIIAENQVDNDFGVVNVNTVSYRHDLTWLTPPADVFVFAELTIKSFGALGSNDIVSIETIDLGPLVNGTLGSAFFSTTVFAGGDQVLLNALLADGYLDVSIDKNQGAGFLGQLNASSVYSSQLKVSYEVPEPATLVLIVSGVLMGLSRRRTKA